MKKFSFTLIFSTLFLAACNHAEETLDSKAVAEERNAAKFSAGEKYDADFLVDIADILLCEIKTSQTALERATLSITKDLASTMIENHKKLYDEIKILADKKSITIPNDISVDLSELSANLEKTESEKYDEEYCHHIIDSNKETILKFERASKNAEDPQIKEWAHNVLPQLRKDLDSAYACEDAHMK